MAFSSDSLGAVDDVVRLELGGKELLVAESYEVAVAVCSQPASWALRTGWGGVAADLLKAYPPGIPFRLSIGNVVQQGGLLEDIDVEQDGDGGTTVTFAGRDWLAALERAYVREQKSFTDPSYLDLVKFALAEVGLADRLIVRTNTANRKARAGVPVTELSLPHRTVDEILQETGKGGGSTTVGVVRQQLLATLGETLHGFLRKYLDRAGLVLWAAADGTFVLSTPNIHQEPVYSVIRRRVGSSRATVTVEHARYRNATSHRHSEVIVYGKGGGKRVGRAKSKGGFVDDEMVGYGFKSPIVVHDKAVQNAGQALFLAQRRISDERRSGSKLDYVVTGHTVPAIGSGARAVWTPDTLVEVDDELLGIKDRYYLEACEYHRGANDGTTTTLHLQRAGDMLFGELAD